MPKKEAKKVTNRARLKRKEQRLRAQGYDLWAPKRAKKKEKA